MKLHDEVSDRWSQERFEGMAMLFNLSEKDQRKMKELQTRLKDIDHWKNDPYEVVRFYTEYKGKLNKVEQMFRNMVHWRQEENIDEFLDNYQVDPLFHQWPISILNTTDKDGDPILVERHGKADLSFFANKFGPDKAAEYSAIFVRELYSTRSFWKQYEDRVGRRVRKCTIIIDLEGCGLDLVRPTVLSLLKKHSLISQHYYPGWGKGVILLRAPSCFKFGFSMVKPCLEKTTQESIIVTKHSDYLDVLQNRIELENLPPCIYPKGQAEGMGYFQNVSLEGGSMKKMIRRREPTCPPKA